MMSGVPWLHQMMMKWSWSTKLQDFVMQAGLTLKPAKLLMICGLWVLVISRSWLFSAPFLLLASYRDYRSAASDCGRGIHTQTPASQI